MIRIHIICSKFIILKQNIKLLLAQHIPLLGLYIAAICSRDDCFDIFKNPALDDNTATSR
jgi:hypothetical protein